MIDVETLVFDKVFRKLTETNPEIYITGGYVAAPPSFPAVTVMEMSNVPLKRTADNTESENHAVLMYEVNVYTAIATGKRSQCRGIVSEIDDIMTDLGFRRIMLQPIPDADPSIYRMTARYEGVMSQDHKLYRR